MSPSRELKRQLQEQKFLHAEAYVRNSAGTLKHMTTSELAHINQMLTGENEEPWRLEPVQVTIPSGNIHHFNIVSNPIIQAREILGHAQDLAANGDLEEAALYLYSRLVLNHFFSDANRRTAILATLWLLQSSGADVNAVELARAPVGDLRDEKDLQTLRAKLMSLIKLPDSK